MTSDGAEEPLEPAPVVPSPLTAEPPAEQYLVSETERSAALSTLVRACSSGRMTLDEFSRRTDLALVARTRSDLLAASGDLDVDTGLTRPLKRRWFVLFGHRVRRGRFVFPERVTAFVFTGEIYLDLRGATLVGPEPAIKLWVLAGNLNLLVPKGVKVAVDQSSLFGGRSLADHEAGASPSAPTLQVRMIDVLGSVRVSNDADEWGRGLVTKPAG